ncbi:hypothetical protein DNTS_009922 [Danionella cerebrum]|uniref:Carbohydrate sulfotransferase n=1 Tax=Danionella cerebrum TaxID=2873325 RepID=A0A553PV06_9TELE|nr:hypothetical protein DNTS_009922 [Danionella translucida]
MGVGVFNLNVAPPQPNLTKLALRQAHRKDLLKELCSENSNLSFFEKLRTFDQIPDKDLNHLIVDDLHGIIYCYVPKVACTNWKRVMIVLSQSLKAPSGALYKDPLDIPLDLIHNFTLHTTIKKLAEEYGHHSRALLNQKLKNYTKFLFVRDPFVRLISGFRDKFLASNGYYFDTYGKKMLQRYANVSDISSTFEEGSGASIRLTFNHFVKYLLDPEIQRRQYDDHWELVHRICHPCQIDYDFIGKLETLEEDAEHLLKILGLDKSFRFPPAYDNSTGADWLEKWFADISLAERRELYRVYEADFKLFGYDKPSTLLEE